MPVAQDGSGNVAVVVDGSNNSVTVSCGEARLTLLQRHKRRREPRKHLDLLDPYSRAIDLVGRDDDLGALEVWLASARPIGVRCLTGRAGSGKTRLAVELCESAEGSGWLTEFVTHDELVGFQQRQHLANWRWPQPTLVVVDYAAASARVLRRWLEQLADHQGDGGRKLRLLLLERHASAEAGWWAELTRFSGFGSAGLEDSLDPPVPVALPSLRTVAQRRDVLSSVMAAASRLDGIDPPLQPPAPGADARYEARLGDDLLDNEPLYLMMAGLTAVRARVPHSLANGREDLAQRLAAAEIERIGRLARDRAIDGAFLQHLAACVTLTGGIAHDAAEQLVLEEQQALRLPAVDAVSVAAALTDALPTPLGDAIDAIRPDLIGEAATLAAFVLARRTPDRQAAIVERAWRRAPAQTVAAVVRSAQDYAPPNGKHATITWLQHLADLADEPTALMSILDEVPVTTTSMRELAALMYHRVVEFSRKDLIRGESSPPVLAGLLSNLANRLSDLGQRDEALAAEEEAEAIRRKLAAADPHAFRSELAASLNNLAVRLSDVGQREKALHAAEEAVEIRRELAGIHPDAFRSDLAMSINNLAIRLSNVGRHQEALNAADEAVKIRRELAAIHPDTFHPDLAGSLSNLANRLSELGQNEAALTASEHAVAIWRELAAAHPDAFRPGLAGSLGNLANRLSVLSRHEAALPPAEQAVAIWRELAAAHPDAFGPELAISLNNLAGCYSDLGRHEAALNTVEKVAELYRKLATDRPDAFRHYLAASLSNLAVMLSDVGQRKAALTAAEEATELYHELAAASPDAFRPSLAAALCVASGCLERCGRLAEALTAIGKAIEVMAPAFLGLPGAFGHRMFPMVQQYLGLCQTQWSEPDAALLEPLMPALEAMMQRSKVENDEGEST